MKPRAILILLASFCSYFSDAQNYIPLQLDTTCYWITYVMRTDGLQQCANYMAYVIKDSVQINNKTYWQMDHFWVTDPGCNLLGYPTNGSNYVREDTTAKTVLMYTPTGDEVLIDFNLHVGDTLSSCETGEKKPVDSVNYINTIGLQQVRSTYTSFHGYLGALYTYQTMEGIGSTSGLGCPQYFQQLICYSKGGQLLYQQAQNPCIAPIPVQVKTYEANQLTMYRVEQAMLVENPNRDDLQITIYNSVGQVIQTMHTQDRFVSISTENLLAGYYILQVQRKQDRKAIPFIR